MSGLRYNEGKTRWGLLSWPAVREVVKVLEFGAAKYAAWNWTKGLSWTQCFESMQRHLQAWYLGEDKDPETGLSHMAHVLCNAMFLMHFILFKTGTDDRPVELRQGETPSDSKQSSNVERNPNQPAQQRSPFLWVDPNTVVERGVSDVQADLFPETQSRGC